MRLFTVFASAILVGIANAHSAVWNIYVNDVNQGVGNTAGGYIRFPPNNSPVKDITSNNLTCNVANIPATKTVSAAAGDKITVEWHHNDNTAADDIIDGSHKGPVLVYIAPTSSNGAGNVWVKLAEDGFSNGTWAVDTLKANAGKHSFTLPSVLADGAYLIRPEIIALHEADVAYTANPARGAQFYMECIQLNVSGGGSTMLPTGVAIPGAYSYTDPGVVFNLYGTFTSYTIPGPSVWNLTSGGATNTSSPAPSASAVAPAASSPVGTAAPPGTTTVYACSTSLTSASQSTLSTVVVPAASSSAGAGTVSGVVAKYSQCGGKDFSGSTSCASGTTCQVLNPYYSQCL